MTRSRPEKRPKRSKGAEVNDWRPRRWSHGHGRRGIAGYWMLLNPEGAELTRTF
jgi:hypothetical protein